MSFRRYLVGLIVVFFATALGQAAEQRTFNISGANIQCEEITSEVAVLYRSMRLNRAINAWNVEILITNRGNRPISAPIVVSVEEFRNCSGLLTADGTNTAKAFVDLSSLTGDGLLGVGEVSLLRTLTLGRTTGSPVLTTKVFALASGGPTGGLAFTRSLNELGQPLRGVQVDESGPAGARTYSTDPEFGTVTLGQGRGEHRWKFSRTDYLPVWRQVTLNSNGVEVVPHPRLTLRQTNTATFSALSGGDITNRTRTVAISFGPSAFDRQSVAQLTGLTPQTLPGFLPLGWSPLEAFWIELSVEPSSPGRAILAAQAALNNNDRFAFVEWNQAALRWDIVDGSGSMPIAGSGAYALVVADAGPLAPPVVTGSVLSGSVGSIPAAEQLRAGGVVTPPISVASTIGELVTTSAALTVTNLSGATPSGVLLRTEISEQYDLTDNSRRVTPAYETFVVAYQRPDDQRADTLNAEFPIRPLLLLGSEELREAVVKADILTPVPFSGAIIEQTGGQISGPTIRLLAGSEDFARAQATLLREVNPTNFVGIAGTNGVVAAFDLAIGELNPGQRLLVQFPSQTANSSFVLARTVYERGLYGLEPVERFQSAASGALASVEPVSGERLSGIAGPGQYLLVHVPSRQVLVTGTVRNAGGQSASGLPVRLAPWLTFSRDDGRYALVAPAGPAELVATDLTSGDEGRRVIDLPSERDTLAGIDLQTVASGLQVISTSPTNTASRVSRISPITVTFNKPLNAGTIVNGGIQLLATNGQIVATSVSLNLKNTTVTILPVDPLPAGARHEIRVAESVADVSGGTLQGNRQFAFVTEVEVARPESAQLTIFEPGATNLTIGSVDVRALLVGFDDLPSKQDIVVAYGSPGTAESEVPVLLANETSGQTATVLSKVDGSFAGFINGSEEDFISAVIINRNDTRTIVKATRQQFDDGTVGLFESGGSLEAPTEDGPVQVTIAPGMIQTRTLFKLDIVKPDEFLGLVKNVGPTNASLIGGSLRLKVSGDRMKPETGGMDISFPLTEQRLRALGFAPGDDPREATYLMTVPTIVNGEFTYCVVDSMEYENGRVATHSYPFPGSDLFITPPKPNPVTGRFEINPVNFDEIMQKIQLVAALIDPLDAAVGELLLAPVVMAEHAFPVKLVGKTIQLTVDGSGTPVRARALAGSFVTARTLEGPSLSGARPGRLDPGSMYCLSRQNGFYSLAMPRPQVIVGQPVTSYVLTATHPRFPSERVVELATPAQVTVSGTDLVFVVGTNVVNDPRPPELSVWHDPEFPIPAATNTANLRTLAGHSSGTPVVEAIFDSITSLVPGVSVSIADVVIGTAESQPAGPTGVRTVFPITCSKAARVTFKVTATAASGQQTEVKHRIAFGGTETVTPNPPAADVNDKEAPRVISSIPQESAVAVAAGDEIRIAFNEAIKDSDLNSAITLSPEAGAPHLILSPGQQEVLLIFPELQPDTPYTLTVSSSVRDLSGNVLDQIPSSPEPDDFNLHFRTAPATLVPLPGIVQGGGTVVRGIYSYALERAGPLDGALVAYDLSNPAAPVKVGELSVPGFPRDLALIPKYSFKLTPSVPAQTKDLLAIVGGKTGGSPDESGNLLGGFQYMWIVDISDPTAPKRIASAAIVLSAETAVSKVTWDPPTLGYLEASGDLTSVGLVDLQTFILGSNMTREEFGQVPEGRPGEDANVDGDYVDDGDTLPIPARTPAQFAGKTGAVVLDDTTQRILDFDLLGAGAIVGVTVGPGLRLGIDGLPLNSPVLPAYRTLASGELDLPRTQASVEFPGRNPKRVKLLSGVPLQIGGQFRVVNLAVISLEPNGSVGPQLAVLDVTDPLAPALLQTIDIDPSHGIPQSLTIRDDGKLLLATTKNVLILDPLRLSESLGSNPTHPSIIGMVPGIGSGARTFGSVLAGLNTVSLGNKNLTAQTAPRISFVQLRDGVLFRPAGIVDNNLLIETNLALLEEAPFLLPARFRTVPGIAESTLRPPAREVHYYVRVDAPGSTGATLDLCLESLNAASYPLRNRGSGFPPVRAASSETLSALRQTPGSCDATIRALTAHRLSSDKRDPNYNVYISRPFALTYEAYSEQELQDLRSQFDREIIWSGAFIRASLDPVLEMDANPVLKSFASRVDETELVVRAGASAIAEALEADYIMGPNPPPVNGHADAPGTFGTVAVHNGEFRMNTVDFELPSRRMPIQFERHYGGQDLYHGPFGRGWDFNYNQRLGELEGGIFAPGMKMPLVVRGNSSDEIGQAKDIILQMGDGRIALFAFMSNSPPTEYSQDELVKDLRWDVSGIGFYRPPEGLFDLLVRFGDGKYGRLTPEGTRYWYSRNGKLEKIEDRYTNNVIQLEYNQRGELRKIIDRSVSERYLELGYYRAPGDSEAGTPDKTASRSAEIGLICALRDKIGSAPRREVNFAYDECGRMTKREGVNITSGHNLAFTGRELTTYVHASDPRFASANGMIGLVEGSTSGSPLFSATGLRANGNVPVVTSGTGANNQYEVSVQHDNTAQAVAAGTGKTLISGPDGSKAEFGLDRDGRPSSILLSGAGGSNAEVKYDYTNGLVRSITYPEGNSVVFTYDSGNVRLRSRGNILTITRNPGPRGGAAIPSAGYGGYNPRYNFPVGIFADFNGNSITYQPTADGLDIGNIVYPGPNGGTVEIRYYPSGQLAFEKNVEGFETAYVYDSDGFLEVMSKGALITRHQYSGDDGARGLPTMIIPPEGGTYTLDYNERGELITITRAGGYSEKLSHDINGNIVRRDTSVSASESLVEESAYLQNGFLRERKWLSVETDGGSQDLTVTMSPDNAFRVTEVAYSPGGRSRKYLNYDHLGRPGRMEIDDYAEDYSYDRNGNLLSITRGSASDQFAYDGYDRLVTNSISVGTASETIVQEYLGNGEVTRRAILDATGNITREENYLFDSSGRPRQTTATSDSGTAITQYSYSQGGRTLQVTTPSQEQITSTYNAAGQLIAHSDSTRNVVLEYQGGTDLKRMTSTENGRPFFVDFTPYDSLNHSEALSDGVGKIADLVPRVDGQVEEVTDALGNSTQRAFSKLGEMLSRVREDSVEFRHAYAFHRENSHSGDNTGAGHTITYDNAFREKTFTLRDPSSTYTATSYDLRNNTPLVMQAPGGSVSFARDAKGRMTSRQVTLGGRTRAETYGYDALDRAVSATFPQGSATLDYDVLGPLRSSTVEIHGAQYNVATTIRVDGARLTITYPAGDNSPAVTVSEGRDPAGRLTTVLPGAGDPVLAQSTYGTAELMTQELLGNSIILTESIYDDRKRLVSRSYRRSNGPPLAEVRYAYDGGNNLVARQYMHRAGRADLFAYDNGNRLTRAFTAVRPQTDDAAARNYPGFTLPANVPGSWAPGFFDRRYSYSADALDLLASVVEINPDELAGAVFATNYSGADSFLNTQSIDGVLRASDELGNTIQTRLYVRKMGATAPEPVNATLRYNGLSQLIHIARADGVTIDYEYDHEGFLSYRTVRDPSGPGGTNETAFVWMEGLLLAEYDRTDGNRIKARYFYGPADVPLAADIADPSGALQRFYLLQEGNGSIMALADGNGEVAERYFYDAWGQPEIQPADTIAPRVRSITSEGENILIEFSERVLPPVQGAGSALATQLSPLGSGFTVREGGSTVAGAFELVEQALNKPFGVTLRFIPDQTLSGPCTLTLNAGAVVDEWNNPIDADSIDFTFNSVPGLVLFSAPDQSSSALALLARSAAGLSLLFHGQLFDYDAGLCYMRARFYDPSSGLFLQSDPDGYEDSPNLYAGFGNNPTSYRDPSGTIRIAAIRASVARYLIKTGKHMARTRSMAWRPLAVFLRRTGDFVSSGVTARSKLKTKKLDRAMFADGFRFRYNEHFKLKWELDEIKARAEFPADDPNVFSTHLRNEHRIELKANDGFNFTAKINHSGMVEISVYLQKIGTQQRSQYASVLGSGKDNYMRMFADWGDNIKGWEGFLVADNYKSVVEVMAKTGMKVEEAILHSATGKFWRRWAKAKGLRPVVKDADLSSAGVTIKVMFE